MLKPEYAADGTLIPNPMIGTPEKYRTGSPEWCFSIASCLQVGCRQIQLNSDVTWIVDLLRTAVESDPKPWEVWPEEAKGNPMAWIKIASRLDWKELGVIVSSRDKAAWDAISDALARWEVKAREHSPGRPPKKIGCVTPDFSDQKENERDNQSTRGLRRRLHKRASVGDERAASLVEQLAAGSISVNAAATEAGMRPKYLRVPDEDPVKAAKSIFRRKDRQWLESLSATLTQLLQES